MRARLLPSSSRLSSGRMVAANVLRARIAPSYGHREQRSHANQIVDGGGERKGPLDAVPAAMPQFPQQADRLHPAKHFFDAFSRALTDRIARMARGAPIDGTATARMTDRELRDMRRDAHVAHLR